MQQVLQVQAKHQVLQDLQILLVQAEQQEQVVFLKQVEQAVQRVQTELVVAQV